MSRPPRGLSFPEREAWARLSATLKPLHPQPAAPASVPLGTEHPLPPAPARAAGGKPRGRVPPLRPPVPQPPPPSRAADNLDSHWDRRLADGSRVPDLVLDLHEHTLAAAHRRLDAGLAQARAIEARLVLVVTGRPRPVAGADRGSSRGAIRAEILDWLAAGAHAAAIAAVRPAARRHGGEGALYIVLRRNR